MKNLSNNIIKSIEKGAIKPIPRWQYAAKKVLFWFLAITGVLLGALVLALVIYTIQTIDWHLYSMLGYGSVIGFIMSVFPYAFIVLLIIFLIIAYYFYRQTPKGHKVNFSILVGILIILGLSGAFLIHISGINQEAYFQLARMPLYHQMMFTKEREWSQPEKGLLWGEVLDMNKNKFSLRDASGKNWNILYDNNTAFDFNISDVQGRDVKIIGQKKGDDNFQAMEIQIWDGVMNCRGHRNMMMNMHGNRGMMRNMMK